MTELEGSTPLAQAARRASAPPTPRPFTRLAPTSGCSTSISPTVALPLNLRRGAFGYIFCP